ncbi:MAG: S1 RNA-binding domain-containing protein [Anaerolineales bacterium]|nr:S1 RNA-binding domain-containing protein [Anaerolineales bacterium]
MEDLLEDDGLDLDMPKQGDIRKGTVARVSENEILVSIGTKSEGVIPAREIDQIDPEYREELEVGNEITVYVVNPEDQTGNVVLSFVRALEEKDWLLAESMLASGESYDGKIVGFNKGGLIIPIGQLRGFVPASQVSLLRRIDSSGSTPEQRWGEMVDQPITVTVIEVDRERRRLILSERAALQETRESLKDRLLDELTEGDVRSGRVTSLADFGAFVNIDGADGLVHLSEISWDRIEHPREVLSVGQEVEVKVIGVDRERKRIGLSIRQLQEDPWIKNVEALKEGQLIEGTITHLTKFGAFARLGEDLEGLIHISEISEQRVTHPKEVLHEGDVVTLRVIKIEPDRHRIGLSLRKVDSPAYTDFDWKMTLAEVVEETHGEEEDGAAAELPADEVAVEESTLEAEQEEGEEAEKPEADAVDEGAAAELPADEVAVEESTLEAEQEEGEEAEEPEEPEEPEADAVDEGAAAELPTDEVTAEESALEAEQEEVEETEEPEADSAEEKSEAEEDVAAEEEAAAEAVEEEQEEVEETEEPEADSAEEKSEAEEDVAAEEDAAAEAVEEEQDMAEAEQAVEEVDASAEEPADEEEPEVEETEEVSEAEAETTAEKEEETGEEEPAEEDTEQEEDPGEPESEE